jgi:hypothetical protein
LKSHVVSAILFVVAYAILAFGIGAAVWQPNMHCMSTGGDALKIYFDSVWHAKWGSGFYYTGMNFPYATPMQLTGGQAAMNVLLQKLNAMGLPVAQYTIGIVNFVNQLLIPIGVVISYRFMLRLGARNIFAIIGALVLIFCSPLLGRINSHFNLAYPFLIPLILLWVLNVVQQKYAMRYSILLFALLVLFGYNNSYFVLIGSGFVMLVGLALIALKQKGGGYIALSGFASAAVNYIAITLIRDTNGTVKIPAEFVNNTTNLQGLLASPYGEPFIWAKTLFGIEKLKSIEQITYLGLLSLPVLFLVCFYIFKNQKQIFTIKNVSYKYLWSIIIASSILLLIASSGNVFKNNIGYWETHLPFLMQFRAIGRLAYPFFYVFTIASLLLINNYYNKLKNQNASTKALLILGIVLVAYGIDFFTKLDNDLLQYKRWRTNNKFSKSSLQKLLPIVGEKYSCVAMYPPTQLWTDKVIQMGALDVQHAAMQYSYQYGIPLWDAMLSRMNYWQALQGLQLSSSKFVRRDKLASLPKDKEVLLVVDRHTDLYSGELWTLANSKFIGHVDSNISLYAMPLDISNDAENKILSESVRNKKFKNPRYIYKRFYSDKWNARSYFLNDTLLQYKAQKPKFLFEADLHTFKNKKHLALTFWTYSEALRYNNATVAYSIKDSIGNVMVQGNYMVTDSRETYNGFLQGYIPIWYNPMFKTITVHAIQEDAWFDSFLLKEMDADVGILLANKKVLFNNFIIHE